MFVPHVLIIIGRPTALQARAVAWFVLPDMVAGSGVEVRNWPYYFQTDLTDKGCPLTIEEQPVMDGVRLMVALMLSRGCISAVSP